MVFFCLRAEIIFAQPVRTVFYTNMTTVDGLSVMSAERQTGSLSPGAGMTTSVAGACTVCSRIFMVQYCSAEVISGILDGVVTIEEADLEDRPSVDTMKRCHHWLMAKE